jgi:Fic-DOC domain mobile mystery protein B
VVNNFIFKDRDGQTPLPIELQKGLKLKHIQRVGELDEYEEENIAEGLIWLQNQTSSCLTHIFWLKLHKRLFGKVWDWAGVVRTDELNNPYFHQPSQIWQSFKKLEGDLKFWLQEKSFVLNEISARFHERIETIHPFVNGNGRFGRILIEYFCKQKKFQIPTWGLTYKNDPKKRRDNYISVLENARRNGEYEPLIQFMFL